MNHLGSYAMLAGGLLLVGGASRAWAQTQAPPAKSATEAKRAEMLFHQMKAEAQQVQSAAQQFEMLTKNTSPQWLQYDEKWNEIKPAQEALNRRMWRIDSMRTELSPAQQMAVDRSKQAVQQITRETRRMRTLLDQPGVDLKSPQFQACGRELVKSAEALAAATGSKVS
jgi:hypothetical protein